MWGFRPLVHAQRVDSGIVYIGGTEATPAPGERVAGQLGAAGQGQGHGPDLGHHPQQVCPLAGLEDTSKRLGDAAGDKRGSEALGGA